MTDTNWRRKELKRNNISNKNIIRRISKRKLFSNKSKSAENTPSKLLITRQKTQYFVQNAPEIDNDLDESVAEYEDNQEFNTYEDEDADDEHEEDDDIEMDNVSEDNSYSQFGKLWNT